MAVRIQKLTGEVERLVPELQSALRGGTDRALLGSAARSLERAASAVRGLVDEAGPGRPSPGIQALLGSASPPLGLFGSRVVLAGIAAGARRAPSAAAQALAVLLEEPGRAFDAAEIAGRLGCSVPIARTTLHRLVRSGHAKRPRPGRFRARAR